jgi:two-component system, chemotaxis family, protein-glutamate methylesterase/glutaminase
MTVCPSRVVVVAASAGGVRALRDFVSTLDPGLDAAVLVAMRVPPRGDSRLPHILDRCGPLPAAHAEDGEPMTAGRIHVAPPNRHLLVDGDRLRLSGGPRRNGHRPAADPLFRGAAVSHGPRVIGLILSGALDDGALGALTVERHGGVVAVQAPEEATHPGMPRHALESTRWASVLTAAELGRTVSRLAAEAPVESPLQRGHQSLPRPRIGATSQEPDRAGLAGFPCADCGRALYATPDGGRYHCPSGHVWTPHTLFDRQELRLESALREAVRALDDRAELSRRNADPARARGHRFSAGRFAEAADEAEQAARAVHRMLRRLLQAKTGRPT